MSHQSELIATDIEAYLDQHERKELLRFLTCGSVDDGKSTLIGRLLYDSKMIYEDQLDAIRTASKTHGTTGDDFDPAMLTDGLKAEREQGITIDVAYRYFSTAKRKFIIADTPGHEQYTRNMATGASTCDLAIILVDARHGVLPQTRRHSFIVSLLGIRHVIVAINKMDLVDFSQERYEEICRDYTAFAAKLDLPDVKFMPLSALKGDNVVDRSENLAWYEGAPLLRYLEDVPISLDRNMIDFRMPVQYVNRPNLDFRGFCGTIASGIVRPGDEIQVLPSNQTSRVESIVTYDGELDEAFPPMAVTITLNDEIDISRGDMLVRPGNVPKLSTDFDAMVVWMNETPLTPGTPYDIKHCSKLSSGTVSHLRYAIDVNTLHRKEQPTLGLNEIGRCAFSLNTPIAFDPYRANRVTGSFIVIDRMTNNTVGAGMIIDQTTDDGDHWETKPRSAFLESVVSGITTDERAERYGHPAVTVLLTGLTGSGKVNVATLLERRLFDRGCVTQVLRGQNMRMGISRDLGFTAPERSENLRRAAEVARIVNDAGAICIAAFVAPHADAREKAKSVIGDDRCIEVHLAAPVEACRKRDPEAYARADSGEIPQFPGVTAPYEAPEHPDLVVPSHELSDEQCVDRIITLLETRGILPRNA